MSLVEQHLRRLRRRAKTANNQGDSRRLLVNPATSAVALMLAAKDALGEFYDWEPESIWVSLSRNGIDVPQVNRDKIHAGIALLCVPSFYWDGLVFEKTSIAFDGQLGNPDRLDEASTAQLAWAVKEANWIVTLHDAAPRVFEHEPRAYSAVVMYREGFVLAPSQLAFAQGVLNGVNQNTTLQTQVEARWKTLDKTKLEDTSFEETEEGVQLARLAAVELHVLSRESDAARDLALLR